MVMRYADLAAQSRSFANINEDSKRKFLRIFFFPYKPLGEKPHQWLDNVFGGVALLIVGGIILAFIIRGDYGIPLGLISFFGGGALMAFLGWIGDVTGISEDQKKYDEAKHKYNDLLEKWELKDEDIRNKSQSLPINEWLNEDLSNVKKRAMNKLGLKESDLIRPPMIIYGPLFWTTYGIPDDELVYVRLTDGTLRFSCYQLVVVCLSAERIATYSADFNFLRYAFVNEKAIEFLYRDIVSVSTEEKSTNYNLPNGKTMRRAQIFRLTVPGREAIEVVINSPEIKDLLGGEPKLTDHDATVSAIREMLRSKKG